MTNGGFEGLRLPVVEQSTSVARGARSLENRYLNIPEPVLLQP